MIDQQTLAKLSKGLNVVGYSLKIKDGMVNIDGISLKPELMNSFTFYCDGEEFVVLVITEEDSVFKYEWVGDYLDIKNEI